jgi:hypothetical protein
MVDLEAVDLAVLEGAFECVGVGGRTRPGVGSRTTAVTCRWFGSRRCVSIADEPRLTGSRRRLDAFAS